MRPVLLVLVSLIAICTLAIGLDRPSKPADFVIIGLRDFFTLDPAQMSYMHDLQLSAAIYESLLRLDNLGDQSIVRGVAERWSIGDDGRTYTFELDRAARWSNGDPLTAHEFVFAWRRALLPGTGSRYRKFFYMIDGAEGFYERRMAQTKAYANGELGAKSPERARELLEATYADFERRVAVRAIDDHTLEVRTVRPIPYFLDICAFGILSPVHPPTIRAHERLDPVTGMLTTDPAWTKPGTFVGNGPYVPVRWRFKRSMRLEANEHYRAPEEVVSKSIEYVPISDPNTAVLAYMTGAGDWVLDASVDYLPELLEEQMAGERNDVHLLPTFGTYFWSFNCQPELPGGRSNPFVDARVRRAFAMSVDKQLLVDHVKRTGERVAHEFIPPGLIPGFQSPGGLGFDPERARAELAAAGWGERNADGVPVNASGEAFPSVDLLYSTGSYHDDIATAMGAMWREHLGVRITLNGKESKIYKDDVRAGRYMLARGGWFGDYTDPTTFLDLHRDGNPHNVRGFFDERFEAIMKQADAETDPAARMRLLEEAERMTMHELVPVLPIWNYNWAYMFDPERVVGITTHPQLNQYWWKFGRVDPDDLSGDATRREPGVGGVDR